MTFAAPLVALAAAAAFGAGAPPAVGAKAPAFALDSQEGKPVSLEALRGKWVVLYFYPKDFTPGCTLEAHNFQRDLAEYAKRNAAVLGVSGQTAASHKDFCAKEGLDFKLLADVDYKVSAAYGSLKDYGIAKMSARRTFVIDPAGVIREEFLDVRPTGHSEEVLAALDRLRAASGPRPGRRP